MAKIVKRTFGVASALISLFAGVCVMVPVGDILSGDPQGDGIGVLLAVTGLFSGVAVLAGWGALCGLRDKRPALESHESVILRLAAAEHGRLTAADLACNSELSLAQSEVELQALVNDGHAEAIVVEGGVVVYKVRSLLSAAEKRDAVDVLDG